jgi:hypothetical protein
MGFEGSVPFKFEKMKGEISLIQKLDAFIRRHHRTKVLRGLLLSFVTLTVGALLFVLLEGLGRFGVAGRTVLFYTFAAAAALVLATQVLWPLAQWARLSQGLSHEQAARIVGNHFPEVKDKLLNTLQLQRQVDNAQGADVTLLAASIDQRTASLRPLPFASAVDISGAARLLRWAAPVALVVLAGIWMQPDWVTAPAARIVQHRTEFIEPAPFKFVLVNDRLDVPAGDAFVVTVETKGDDLPASVTLESGNGRFRMERVKPHVFRHTFPAVRSNIDFQFLANGWRSVNHTVTPFAVPVLASLRLQATPPPYTGLAKMDTRNQGDVTVPEGTPIQWTMQVSDADSIRFTWNDEALQTTRTTGKTFSTHAVATTNSTYWIAPVSAQLTGDSLRHRVRVIRDGKPSIRVEESRDSLSRKRMHFTGSVQDDYGFSRLTFVWEVVERGVATSEELVAAGGGGAPLSRARVELEVPSGRRGTFYHMWDLREMDWREGDVLEAWFEVWDNDAVHGAKRVRSTTTRLEAPSQTDLREERKNAAESLEENLQDAAREAAELREAMEAMQERLREQGEMTWQDRQAMESLLEQQKDLQEKLEEMRRDNAKKDERANEFSKQEDRILDKQEQLQNMMDDLMSEEMRQLFEQMEKLMQEMDPEKLQEQLNEMELNHDAMEKELDRALEQFRQLEWETKMSEAIEDLNRLAEEQKQLAEDTEFGLDDSDSLKAKQDSLNTAFEQVQKDLEQLKKDNQELENPNPMMDSSGEENSIKQEMEKSAEQLEKGKEKKASDSQNKAAEQMEQLAQQMEAMQQQSESESASEDMDALRALLENILTLSFEEELLMSELKATNEQDPRYVGHGQSQRKLKDDAVMVEDSLFALSMRIPQLASAVSREIGLVNRHMGKALEGFGDRLTAEIAMNQQYVMTSFNNLALLLDEALQQMQQQQAQKQPGSGNCEKPGGSGNPSPSPKAGDMKKMQQALGKKLEQMKEKMGEGGNKGQTGQKKPGGMSKELAQVAAEQAALRKMAQERAKKLNEDGSGDGNGMKEIAKQMEELERDLVNRQVDEATLKRQQDLITRLLEAENAERIRGEKEDRTSRTGDDALRADPPQATEYLRRKMNELELLRTVPAELLPYYRERVNEYFNTLELDSQEQPDLKP